MAGNPKWTKEARVYSTKKEPKEEEAQEPEEDIVYTHIKKGILIGAIAGGGIETIVRIIPEIDQMPYCSKEDIIYRLTTGAITAALLLPIKKEGEDVKDYRTKALCSGVGYAITTMIIYGGLEMITKVYEKL